MAKKMAMAKAAKISKEKKIVKNAMKTNNFDAFDVVAKKISESTEHLNNVIEKKKAVEVSTNVIKKCTDDDEIKCCLECRSLYIGGRQMKRALRKLQPRRLIFNVHCKQ